MFQCTDCNLSFNKPQHYSNHLNSRSHALNHIENLTSNNLSLLQNINPTIAIIPDDNNIDMENQQVNNLQIIIVILKIYIKKIFLIYNFYYS